MDVKSILFETFPFDNSFADSDIFVKISPFRVFAVQLNHPMAPTRVRLSCITSFRTRSKDKTDYGKCPATPAVIGAAPFRKGATHITQLNDSLSATDKMAHLMCLKGVLCWSLSINRDLNHMPFEARRSHNGLHWPLAIRVIKMHPHAYWAGDWR